MDRADAGAVSGGRGFGAAQRFQASFAPGSMESAAAAEWLRRLFAEWFPNAVSIIDFFHVAEGNAAAEYRWAAVGARYGPGSDLAKRWATKLCRLLKAGRADSVLAALRKAGGGECDKAAGYIGERRDRMRYDEYLARGLPIGSGRAEAACKTAVGRRLKCTGMRWTVAGANPVLVGSLRATERLVRRLLDRTFPADRVTVSVHSPRICRAP